jgi:hypothetical protein
MPWGDWINELPTSFFLAVHIAAGLSFGLMLAAKMQWRPRAIFTR